MKDNKLSEIIIGLILGDVSIQKNTSRVEEKWRLKFSQSSKHKEYIYHLHELFRDYVKAAPFFDEKRSMLSFQTLFHSDFNRFAEMFQDEQGRKRVPYCFNKTLLAPRSIAYWFMDDGGSVSYKPRNGIVFNTQAFTFDEVRMLSENLNQSYGINSWIKKNKGKPTIAVSESESRRFALSFLEFVHPSMHYKLSFKV